MRLELKTANGTITGGLAMGNIEIDKEGALRRVGEFAASGIPTPKPIRLKKQ